MIFREIAKKNKKIVGSVVPSSYFLCQKITSCIDFSKDINILEYGPGDGVITDNIVKKLSPNSKLTLIELNKSFYNYLCKKYEIHKNIKIYNHNVSNIDDYIDDESIDYIVSSLPLSFIDKVTIIKILEKSKKILKPNGTFIQYQYFLKNKKDIKKSFSKVKYKFTPINFPPAFIYICNK